MDSIKLMRTAKTGYLVLAALFCAMGVTMLTWPDITPVLKMTWLKNLYMIGGSGSAAYKAAQALPDTRVVASGGATVGSGWRQLPNYYAMRDALGAEYMHG